MPDIRDPNTVRRIMLKIFSGVAQVLLNIIKEDDLDKAEIVATLEEWVDEHD
ncbi:hypothetical protein LCGC14_1750370 [marine sediment metagenome]|uniref:Uncharacterized protein n=1 Tax=marine sediment metagenome TaxID=412755 RepID=A0A0F9K3M0_9ZZZZ